MTIDIENIQYKSKRFTLRCIGLSHYLQDDKGEHVLSQWLSEDCASAGMNIKSAVGYGVSAEGLSHMQVALEHVSKAHYWLELLFDSGYLSETEHGSVFNECLSLESLLSDTVRTMQRKLQSSPPQQ
ncbi:MAG: four helix bundle protein [Muribaculaceae bacterium]|nr:four helix bundle protein [Muribaculaceae bacterium]